MLGTEPAGGLRLLIVDDHPMTCVGLQSLLQSCYPDALIDSLHDANTLAARGHGYDFIFLDMHLPGVRFGELLEHLHALCGRLILISADPEPEIVEQGRACGVRGLLLKNADADQLLDGFRRIRGGARVFAESGSLFGARPVPTELTVRQRQIFEALIGGLSNKQIARKLEISEYTVKEHVTSVLSHFGARNRLELLLQTRQQRV